MAGLFPLRALVRGYGELKTLYHDLCAMGVTALAWSQRRPAGPVEEAVGELKRVAGAAGELSDAGVAYICHSRGGLVLRRALSEVRAPRAMVTICTPHMGTGLSRWAKYVGPAASSIGRRLPESEVGTLRKAVKRVLDFVGGEAVRDLLPGSGFLNALADTKPPGCYCLSVGGKDPRLLKFGGPAALVAVDRLVPDMALPEEMKRGMGDGLVTARSARLPYADEHLTFDVNHAEALFDPLVRRAVLKRLKARLGL
jgi:hypothetical protein